MFYSNEYVKDGGKKFDVVKIVLALMIVCIHSTAKGHLYRSLLRMAVPIFFLMTSYFFFLKQTKLSDIDNQKRCLINYVKRTMKLYLFWFVILLPLTIFYRKWYADFGVNTFIVIFKDFIFSSTFKGSWFLMACVIDITLIWYLSPKIKFKWLFAIGTISYVFCCISSNYYYLMREIGIEQYADYYRAAFKYPCTSFPTGIIYVVTGKYLAERKIFINMKTVYILFVLCLFLLLAETFIIGEFMWSKKDDCFLFLIPSSIFLFMIIGQNQVKITAETKNLRKCSIIMYCSHVSLLPIIGCILTFVGMEKSSTFYCLLLIILSVFTSLIVYYTIIFYREKYAFLKNAY